MKEQNSLLLVTSLIIAIIASIFCVYEWFNGTQESALALTAGSVIAISFYVVAMSLRQIEKNEIALKEKLDQLENKIEQLEKQEEQEEVYVQVPIEH
jgi:multisubunit Na+/H+ antiporter MnhB subunit